MVTLPYNVTYEQAARAVLGAIGEEAAREAGLEKDNSFEEHYSIVVGEYGDMYFPESGPSREEVEENTYALQDKCHELGIHAKLEGESLGGIFAKHYRVIDTKNISSEEVDRGVFLVKYAVVDAHSFTVDAYGALPKGFTGVLDGLEDASSVATVVDEVGRTTAAYQLLNDLEGYNEPDGTTAQMFGLTDSGSYTALREMLETTTETQRQAIIGNKMPIFGGLVRQYQLKQLEKEHDRKAAIIDGLESDLVR